MSNSTQSSTEPFAADALAAIEPSQLQYLQASFSDYLAPRPSDEERIRVWRRELTVWVHERIFRYSDTVAEVRGDLNATFRRTRIIAVTSGKGGVGKTTFSVNFAVACAQLGKRVLLFDADFGMANIHIYAGVNPQSTLLDLLEGRSTIEQVIVPGPGGIEMICGTSGASRLSDLNTLALESLGEQLLRAAANFDVLIIDTAAGISAAVTHFLGLAQDTIVVATPALASTLDAYGVIKLADEIRLTTRLHLLVNQASDAEEAGQVRERIVGCAERHLSTAVKPVGFLHRDPAFERSAQCRRPLVLGDPGNSNAQRIAALAAQFLEEDKSTRPAASEPETNYAAA